MADITPYSRLPEEYRVLPMSEPNLEALGKSYGLDIPTLTTVYPNSWLIGKSRMAEAPIPYATASAAPAPAGGELSYQVKFADTLSEIARDRGISLQSLIDANPSISNPDKITEGAWLSIPTTYSAAAASSPLLKLAEQGLTPAQTVTPNDEGLPVYTMLDAIEVTAPRLGDQYLDVRSFAPGYPDPKFDTLQLQPLQAPAKSMDLESLVGKYMPTGGNYSADIAAKMAEIKTQQSDFNKMLQAALAEPANAPSKAEMYFRLAAAFSEPTKTGHFMESVGKASGVLGEYQKEKRTSLKDKRLSDLKLGLESRKMDIQGSKDELATLRALQAEDIKTKREIAKEMIKDYIASGKPLSEAGRVARDIVKGQGFIEGTPEFQERYGVEVARQSDLAVQRITAQLDAIAATQSAADKRLALEGRRETRAERKEAREEKRLSPAEIKLADDTQQALDSTGRALAMMQQALGYTKQAFTASLGDKAQFIGIKVGNPSDKRVVATEQLEQILTKSGLEGLRAAFGGSPTEGERAIALATQGLDATSVASREAIINRIVDMLKAQSAAQNKKMEEITSGQYGMKR